MSEEKRVFSREELMRSHEYAKHHEVAGHRLHGGFLADGEYMPPRALVRGPAIEAWTRALRARGGDLLAADSSLLAGIRYPSFAQQKLLLQEGLGQTFWNSLTITGMIEARGRFLADAVFPDFQEVTDTDLSDWALGHLNKGLLVAHGIDEGGEPDKGIGGHDVMWFALRDLAFGPTDFPTPEVPENIGREKPERFFPMLPEAYEGTIDFLLNLLMIEFRAERGFALSETMLRDPDLFQERREGAVEAADVVDRIRTDEEIHVTSLRVYLGELRALELKGAEGTVSGAEVVDTLWRRIVHWATVEQPPLMAEQQKILLHARIQAVSAAGLLEKFDALAEAA